MRPAVEAEKLGIPGVVVTTTGFTTIARAAAKAEGMANVRIAEYPGAVGVHAEELVVKNVEDVLFERIVDNLTHSVAGEAAAATSARRAHGKRKGRSMTSLQFGRNSERRGAHRCANDVVVDASGTNL